MPVELLYDASSLGYCDIMGIRVLETLVCERVNTCVNRRPTVPYVSLELYQNNDRRFRVLVRGTDLNIVDITGAVGIFTVRVTKDSAAVSIQKRTDVVGEGMIGAADEGEMYFYVVPADTASLDIRQYVWDVTLVMASGTKYTIVEGVLNLLQAVE